MSTPEDRDKEAREMSDEHAYRIALEEGNKINAAGVAHYERMANCSERQAIAAERTSAAVEDIAQCVRALLELAQQSDD